jgi:hypothetical protein
LNPLPPILYATSGAPFKFRFNSNTFAPLVDDVFNETHPPSYSLTTSPSWLQLDEDSRTLYGTAPTTSQSVQVSLAAYIPPYSDIAAIGSFTLVTIALSTYTMLYF